MARLDWIKARARKPPTDSPAEKKTAALILAASIIVQMITG
jgi:hypothetical protein